MEWEKLLKDSSKVGTIAARDYILKNPQLIPSLVEFTFSKKGKYSQRSARVLYHCFAQEPRLAEKLKKRFLMELISSTDDSIIMNLLHIFIVIPLPQSEKELEQLMNYCFALLDSHTAKPGQKCYSLEIMDRISDKYPELRREIVLLVKKHLPYSNMAFCTRGKKYIEKYEVKYFKISNI